MTQSKGIGSSADLIPDGSPRTSSITPHPFEVLGFAFGTAEAIRPLWNGMCESKSHSGLHIVGLQTQEKTILLSHSYGNRSGGHPVNPQGETIARGSTALGGVTPDPFEPLAVAAGSHEVITDRATVDEIIERHSSAGLADGPGLAGQMQAAYIFGVSPQRIDEIGASAAVLYGLIPQGVIRQLHVSNSQATKCPGDNRQRTKSNLSRQRMKHAVDIQVAIVGSVLYRRPDLYWLFDALMGLSDGLAELEAGFSPPALMRTPRPPDAGRENTYQRVVKSFSVLTWAALVRIGLGKGDAARLIVNHLSKGKFLPPKQPNQSSAGTRSISNWIKRYEAGDLPPLILPSKQFLEVFPVGCKTNPKRVLELLGAYLKGVKAHRLAGGGFRVLRPAELRHFHRN